MVIDATRPRDRRTRGGGDELERRRVSGISYCFLYPDDGQITVFKKSVATEYFIQIGRVVSVIARRAAPRSSRQSSVVRRQ